MPSLELIGKCGRFFWPPRPGDPEADYVWRKKIAIAFYAEALMQFLVVLWIIGALPTFIPTPAWSGDLQILRGDVGNVQRSTTQQNVELRLGQITDQLRNNQKDFCLAQRAQNQLAVDLYLKDMQALRDRYVELTGRNYQFPDCKAVLVSLEPGP